MSKLHLKFRNIRPDVLDAARQLFDRKPHSLTEDGQKEAIEQFVVTVCNAYGVPTPEVRVESGGGRYGGTYEYLPAEAIIGEDGPESVRAAQVVIRKFSALNLFGIVRTHLLNHQAVSPKENEPWGWACSLFYAVKPVRFRRLVREGKIRKGIKVADTYTRATFARMVAAGVAEENGNVLVQNFDPRVLDQIESGEVDIRTILPAGTNPSALSDWSWDDDEDDDPIDLLDEDDQALTSQARSAVEDDDAESDIVREASLATAGALLAEAVFSDDPDRADALEEAAQQIVSDAEPEYVDGNSGDDGLDSLGIVALRNLIRGRVPGGYSLSKPDLIAALRAQGIRSDGSVA